MVESFLTHAWWPGPAIAFVLLWLDYSLTIVGARAYREHVASRYRYEGSYELTPLYQADVDHLRGFSWRVVLAGLVLGLVLWLVAILDATLGTCPAFYLFALGIVILRQVAIFVRHFRILYLARVIRSEPRLEGHIFYPRTFVYRSSAFELASFMAVFLVWALFSESWMPLGGAVGCGGLAMQHLRMARKLRIAKPSGPAETPQERAG